MSSGPGSGNAALDELQEAAESVKMIAISRACHKFFLMGDRQEESHCMKFCLQFASSPEGDTANMWKKRFK